MLHISQSKKALTKGGRREWQIRENERFGLPCPPYFKHESERPSTGTIARTPCIFLSSIFRVIFVIALWNVSVGLF